MKWNLIIFLPLLTISPLCIADDVTPSNLESFSYPNHHCGNKITKPKTPSKTTNSHEVDDYNNAIIEYNIKVVSYNKEIKIYKKCINQYIKNGNNDIKVIRDTLNKALKEARNKL